MSDVMISVIYIMKIDRRTGIQEPIEIICNMSN